MTVRFSTKSARSIMYVQRAYPAVCGKAEVVARQDLAHHMLTSWMHVANLVLDLSTEHWHSTRRDSTDHQNRSLKLSADRCSATLRSQKNLSYISRYRTIAFICHIPQVFVKQTLGNSHSTHEACFWISSIIVPRNPIITECLRFTHGRLRLSHQGRRP